MTTPATAMTNVYDLAYPSPTSLKEISSIVVVMQLSCEEICTHLESEHLPVFDYNNSIQIKTGVSKLPSSLRDSLEPYTTIFEESVALWLNYHHRNQVFPSCPGSSIDILSRFRDFALDWDGTIHNVRTAERMMLCDRFNEDEKFKIACLYCFEDDIKRIWPSVSSKMDLNGIEFQTCPQLYYWICYLRNELHRIPNPRNDTIDELMLRESKWSDHNHSFLKCFWDRLASDRQSQIAIEKFHVWRKLFYRFILPKLSRHQFETFLAEKGSTLMWCLFFYDDAGPCQLHVFRIWMHIRNEISATNFICFIEGLVLVENEEDRPTYHRKIARLICEIWESAPQHLKRSALNYLIRHEPLFLSKMSSWDSAAVKFLIIALRDASFEERNAFWFKNWRNLLNAASGDNLQQLMTLCLRNENETTLSEEDSMATYENITEWCVWLLDRCSFGTFTVFSVCYPDERKRREFERRFLRSNYLGENSLLTMKVFDNYGVLDELIDDAFQDAADLGVEFRSQFTSSTVTQNCIFECIRRGSFHVLMEFVDLFFRDEKPVVGALKERLFVYFKEHVIAGSIPYDSSVVLESFVCWLLGNDEDEVIKFKKSISVDDIFRAMVQFELEERAREDDEYTNEFPEKIDEFLFWYFNECGAKVEEFKNRFPDEVNTLVLRKRRRIDSSDYSE